ASEMFTTFAEGQTNVKIHVLQGERELVKDSRSLAQFDLKDIPPMPAGMPRIEGKVFIDADGVPSVTPHEKRTRKHQSVPGKAHYGIAEEKIETMIFEFVKYSETDNERRQVDEGGKESRNRAKGDGKRNQRRKIGGTASGRKSGNKCPSGSSPRRYEAR